VDCCGKFAQGSSLPKDSPVNVTFVYLSLSIGVDTFAVESVVRHFADKGQGLIRCITKVVKVKYLHGVSTLKMETK
jgi:hypothetical protein